MVNIKTETVQIKNGELLIDAYLAIPQTEGKFSAIIVVQEIFGVNNHIQDVTRRIAQEGYIAIAPAIYQRLAPGFTAGYTMADINIGKEYKNQTQATELISDLEATINYLYSLPQVKTTGVGTIGFCFGGHVVYLAATIEAIKATASFYGAGITTWTPGGGVATVSKTKDIKGTISAFFGLEDTSIPVAEIDQIQGELEKYQIPHQIYRYPGADHGFFCDQRASYNQEAAEDAWQKVLTLYAQILT